MKQISEVEEKPVTSSLLNTVSAQTPAVQSGGLGLRNGYLKGQCHEMDIFLKV
jgi:hypothetical protein